MPYVMETCMAGDTYEVRKYFTYQHKGTGTKRAKKENPTPERIKKASDRAAEIKLRRLMNHNFKDGDYLLRLDFSKGKRPEENDDMQKEIKNFIDRLSRRYKRAESQLKYIYVKEIGPKGGRHVHMMINKCDVDWIRKCWKMGGVHVDPLYSDGQYGKIASYFMKYSNRTDETEGKRVGKRYYPSRNLVMPPVKKMVISANSFKNMPGKKDGYYLEKDSVIKGINELTGYEYFCYTLHKIQSKVKGG